MTPLDPRELKGAQLDLLGAWTDREEACPDWGCMCPDRPLVCPDRPLVRPDPERARTQTGTWSTVSAAGAFGGGFSYDGAVLFGLKVSKPKGTEEFDPAREEDVDTWLFQVDVYYHLYP